MWFPGPGGGIGTGDLSEEVQCQLPRPVYGDPADRDPLVGRLPAAIAGTVVDDEGLVPEGWMRAPMPSRSLSRKIASLPSAFSRSAIPLSIRAGSALASTRGPFETISCGDAQGKRSIWKHYSHVIQKVIVFTSPHVRRLRVTVRLHPSRQGRDALDYGWA